MAAHELNVRFNLFETFLLSRHVTSAGHPRARWLLLLMIDPQQIEAHIQKGYALARKVESGALPPESWKDVRTQFLKANKVENDHPIPRMHFYLTYTKAGVQPTKNAIDGLEWAKEMRRLFSWLNTRTSPAGCSTRTLPIT